MKAVFVKSQNAVTVDNIVEPKISRDGGDVSVRMRACGLCGSDLEKIYGDYGMTSGKLGHEPAGEVIDTGEDVQGFSQGDRVFVHHHVPCYACHYCLHGDYTMCPAYQTSNLNPCGLAEEFVVPEWNVSRGGLLKLADSVSFDEASMLEPLACCLRALNKTVFQKGDDVAIFGAGPAGLMHAMLAQLYGAGRILIIDVNEFRLEFAQKVLSHNDGGVTALNSGDSNISARAHGLTGGRGVDLAIVATGNTRAISSSFELTRKGGKILLFGVPPKNSSFSLAVGELYSNEQSIIPSYAASEVETNQALKLITEKKIDTGSLITHRFDISEAVAAFQCAHEAKDSMKVIVTTRA